jgi:YHS domain-containing protein
MVFALWLLRILIILLIVRYIVSFFTARRPPMRRGASTRAPERTGGTLVRDPQCGTYVPQSGAVSLKRGGATMYFCSATCRDTWLAGH